MRGSKCSAEGIRQPAFIDLPSCFVSLSLSLSPLSPPLSLSFSFTERSQRGGSQGFPWFSAGIENTEKSSWQKKSARRRRLRYREGGNKGGFVNGSYRVSEWAINTQPAFQTKAKDTEERVSRQRSVRCVVVGGGYAVCVCVCLRERTHSEGRSRCSPVAFLCDSGESSLSWNRHTFSGRQKTEAALPSVYQQLLRYLMWKCAIICWLLLFLVLLTSFVLNVAWLAVYLSCIDWPDLH